MREKNLQVGDVVLVRYLGRHGWAEYRAEIVSIDLDEQYPVQVRQVRGQGKGRSRRAPIDFVRKL